MYPNRNRFVYAPAIIIVIAAGLLSRKFNFLFPEIVNNYLGDALWAVMIYGIIAFIFKDRSIKWVALYSLLFCYAIEISQLYHAPWIDTIRNTRLGGLVLGFGFLWSDLLAYALGIALAMFVEWIVYTKPAKNNLLK
ncbi:MAG: DUF2809 domain-containing protein [Paludibacter sp.]|nr:DUF2809 domain-containing protein [Paludibacter sp.]